MTLLITERVCVLLCPCNRWLTSHYFLASQELKEVTRIAYRERKLLPFSDDAHSGLHLPTGISIKAKVQSSGVGVSKRMVDDDMIEQSMSDSGSVDNASCSYDESSMEGSGNAGSSEGVVLSSASQQRNSSSANGYKQPVTVTMKRDVSVNEKDIKEFSISREDVPQQQ